MVRMTTVEFSGAELEHAYANVLGGRVIGGFNDCGLDVAINDKQIPAVQVKPSIVEACKFLAVTEKRRCRFIPICIGLPGTREAVLDSLRKFGAWIEDGIPGRDRALTEISRIRQVCMA